MKITAKNLSWSIGYQTILRSINLFAESTEFIGIVGPNGSGKTSLLRLMARIIAPSTGIVQLDDLNIWGMSQKVFAQLIAVVSQENPHDFHFTVEEIVMMGRLPHKGLFDPDNSHDYAMAHESLKRVGMAGFDHRVFSNLSGGEKQRVLIARALTQTPNVLLLDEPTNHLDIRYQLEILELLKSLEITTIVVLHDLNLAAAFCDRIYVLKQGKIVAEGLPEDVLTEKQIRDVYGVTAQVELNQRTHKINISYLGVIT